MYPSITDSLILAISAWEPKTRGAEPKYRDDLVDYLRSKLWSQFSFTKEARRGLCDISVNRQVGIELKKDLKTKSQIDRLIGQVREHKRDYQEVIIVLVGKTNKDALDQLRQRRDLDLRSSNSLLGDNQSVPIIDMGGARKPVKKQTPSFSAPNFPFNPFG